MQISPRLTNDWNGVQQEDLSCEFVDLGPAIR